METDERALVRAKGEWGREDPRRFDGNGLEEGQDVITIVCNGVQGLGSGSFGGGLLCLTWICFGFLGFNSDDPIVVIGLVCLACGNCVLRPLRDGAGENLEELDRVRLAVKDCGFRQKCREEDGVAWSPVYLLIGLREVVGGGAKKDTIF